MDVATFEQALAGLGVGDLRSVATDLALTDDTPAARLESTRAMLIVEHALRRAHSLGNAAAAALSVSSAVQGVARRESVPLPDSEVTRVARAAAQLARALVAADAEPTADVAAALRSLGRGWSRLACCAGLAA